MDGRQRDFLTLTLGCTALVMAFGIVHDQVLAALVPQHFEVYYPQYLPLRQAWAQALVYPLLGNIWPGAVWGALLYGAAKSKQGLVLSPRKILVGVSWVMLLTVAVAWWLGCQVKAGGTPPYPTYFFPSDDKDLFFSETVELTYALAGTIGGVVWVAAVFIWRLWRTPKPVEGT